MAAALLLLALTGCSGSQDDTVSDLARDFHDAVAAGDGASACAVLTPSTRTELKDSSGKECARAILEEQIPKVSGDGGAEVFGTMARVEYVGDTVFLTRLQDGWHVLAAGCTPRPHGLYDCVVKGS